jgi:hypothetical protein
MATTPRLDCKIMVPTFPALTDAAAGVVGDRRPHGLGERPQRRVVVSLLAVVWHWCPNPAKWHGIKHPVPFQRSRKEKTEAFSAIQLY